MNAVRRRACDLRDAWNERDRRYGRRLFDENVRAVVFTLRSAELRELEAAAVEGGVFGDLEHDAPYRELLSILDGWAP